MPVHSKALSFIAGLFSGKRRDEDLDDELRSYVELLSQEKTARGMPLEKARREALLEVGGLEQVKEEVRSRRPAAPFEAMFQDVRYGARMLLNKPGFSAVAVLTLALGIGANTAIFSIVNATLLTPVPVPSPERVVMVATENVARGFHKFPASVPDYLDWKASGVFDQLAVFNTTGLNIRLGNQTERLDGAAVSPEWFAIVNARPFLGRMFRAEDVQPGRGQVAVVTHDFWTSHLHSDASAIGQSIVIDGKISTLIGVLPKGAAQFEHEQMYVPAVFDKAEANRRGSRSWLVVGRIAPGLSFEAAQARMTSLSARLAAQYPNEDKGNSARLQLIEESYVEDVKDLLVLLFGAVGFVLVVACANIANLLLVRGTARRKELAIRVAVGAGRLRLMSQLISESLLLSVLGGIAGIVPAWIGIRLISQVKIDLPNAAGITLNTKVLLFALAISVAAGLVFGLLPAWQVWKTEANEPLRETGRGQTSGRSTKLGNIFVVGQMALTLVLLAGAGLMLRSFMYLRDQSPGYNTHGAMTMNIALSSPLYEDKNRQNTFFRAALEEISSLPGVQSAAFTDSLPGSDTLHGSGLHFADRPEPAAFDEPIVLTSSVSPRYFQAMGIPLLRGRTFQESDTAASPLTVMVDDLAARKFWPNQDCIGKKIKLEKDGPVRTIVGVVTTVEQNPLVKAATGGLGQLYTPLAQAPRPGVSLVVRSAETPSATAAAVRDRLAKLDRDVPLYRVQTLEENRWASHASIQLGTALLATFGAIALLLASIGIYGVVAYTVGQRTREFGIRLAVGASSSNILRLTLGKGAWLVFAGAGIGLLGAIALTRLMRNLLTGIGPNDPVTFIGVTVLLAGVGLLASYIPARRASRVDPTLALRAE